MPQPPNPFYETFVAPYVFDLLSAAVFGPSSLASLRDRVVDQLMLTSEMRVLELGCGSGAVTRRLVATGAQTVAVDRSGAMLRRARRRAPGADFRLADATAFESAQPFQRVLCMFFLHELDSGERTEVLRRVGRLLTRDGFALVVDVADGGGPARSAWRRFVDSFEPPTVREVMAGALLREAVEAGLQVGDCQRPLDGRVQVIPLRVAP